MWWAWTASARGVLPSGSVWLTSAAGGGRPFRVRFGQQRDDLVAPGPGGVMMGVAPAFVCHPGIGPAGQERLDGAGVPALGRVVERPSQPIVADIGVGAGPDQQGDGQGLVVQRGSMERPVAGAVAGVRIGAGGQQDTERLDAALAGGPMQGSPP